MNVEIAKWGNSLALRIPAKLAKEIKLSLGAKAQMTLKNGALVVTPQRKSTDRIPLAELVASLDGKPEGEMDWGPDVGREIVEW